MTVAEIERIIETTEPREMSSTGDRVWTRRMAEALHGRLATVERTIANEALRRAAEVVENNQEWMSIGKATARGLDTRMHGNQAGLAYADAIRALIKEPGHE